MMKLAPSPRPVWLFVLACGISAAIACGSSGGAGSGSGGGAQGGAAGGSAGSNGSGGVTMGGSAGVATGGNATGGTTVVDASAGGSSGAGTGGAAGGNGTGGSAGGSDAGPPPSLNRVRTVIPFDDAWRFFAGDATGADQPAFADTSWRAVNVPHDWSIEGPYDANSPVLGNGGYLPAGIGWYRKHFTLPANLSGSRIFVEFDGVMANSDVYINGVHVGTKRPYGYVSFRYEITAQAMFGTADNVIAVRADNSAQPASRWYTGAGIYRHVRVLATNATHVAQWSTFVTTPAVSAASATVHVQTTVTNQGAAVESVALQAVVIDPSGTKLAPVSAAAQNIAAGASADFTLDVPVASPKLWSTTSPALYQLLTNVEVGGATVDDDLATFGIRTIKFDPDLGFSLNGTSMKFKGVGMHHDVSGLGSAVPVRAWQRRLAQLKSIGVNAIRTGHGPVAPEVLDLCDRMGFMVLDEFFDAWTAHKQAADYGGATFNTWGTVDMTDTIKRDRNHPSIVLYSIGNEIRDALASKEMTATNLVAIAHGLDNTRPVTQALFRPMDSGDFPGAMLDILDVFGANYRIAEIISAESLVPHHAGVCTEMTLTLSDWTTITNTPQLTGEFLWTGFDYLGEVLAPNTFPIIGSSTGLMDRMGTRRDIAYSYQGIWGTTPVLRPTAGTTASKIALTADHASIVTDRNDVAYIKAALADNAGNTVTSATGAVTFAVTGPGTIIAVDSGSNMAESYRGNVRNAFGGLAFAIVQATGPGTITVTASTPGLTDASVTVTSMAGTFAPCSGSCD